MVLWGVNGEQKSWKIIKQYDTLANNKRHFPQKEKLFENEKNTLNGEMNWKTCLKCCFIIII